MLELILDPLALGFMQRALLASMLVGALTALVGTYVVLKGLAFIGDWNRYINAYDVNIY